MKALIEKNQIFVILGFLGDKSGDLVSNIDFGRLSRRFADSKRKISLSRDDSSLNSASRIIHRESIFFTEASFKVFSGRESELKI